MDWLGPFPRSPHKVMERRSLLRHVWDHHFLFRATWKRAHSRYPKVTSGLALQHTACTPRAHWQHTGIHRPLLKVWCYHICSCLLLTSKSALFRKARVTLSAQALSNAGPPPAARSPARRLAEGAFFYLDCACVGTQRGNMSQAWYRSCSSCGQLVDSSWFETASLHWLAAQGVANLGLPLSPQSKTCSGSSTLAPLPQQDYVFFVAAVMFSCEQKS